jgi:hypothetical protein
MTPSALSEYLHDDPSGKVMVGDLANRYGWTGGAVCRNADDVVASFTHPNGLAIELIWRGDALVRAVHPSHRIPCPTRKVASCSYEQFSSRPSWRRRLLVSHHRLMQDQIAHRATTKLHPVTVSPTQKRDLRIGRPPRSAEMATTRIANTHTQVVRATATAVLHKCWPRRSDADHRTVGQVTR